ncbi:MAG: GAF domain-containing sensor histidine kinase, partial [Acidobacteria bacterium]|nr:GAF domain-containing sensor histidine kinase [Acidobacteriota bacterium]
MARGLEPYLAEITAKWRELISAETSLLPRALTALERLTLATGSGYFANDNFAGFFENLSYFGIRLAKLDVDTRIIARSLELYQGCCEPYLSKVADLDHDEAVTALEMLSSATVVTISNAYFDVKSRQSAALLSVLDAELSAGDLEGLLSRVLRVITSTFSAANGALLLRDPETEMLQVTASTGLPAAVGDELSIRVGEGFSGKIAESGEAAICVDTAEDDRIGSEALRSSARSIWGVPMKTESGVIGVLLIGFNKRYEWLPSERELLRAISDRSALAIDRARINDALREREARIAQLSAHLLQVQEQERKRISRELHDETGQGLMVIRLYLGMLEAGIRSRTARAKIRETVAVVDRTIDGIRRIIGRLSPLVLEELGLISAIRKEAKDFSRNTGVRARVAVPSEVGRLRPETEAAIYRVVQEALHNVAKHAQAANVSINMQRDNGTVRLTVEDDGVGFQPRFVSSSRGNSFGLAGIKERVGMLGGAV